MKKLMIVGGDSYTDPNFGIYKKFNISPWPTHLAKLNNYDMINTATGGSSNRHIFNSVVDAIIDNQHREIIVVAAWSELYRLSFIDDVDLDSTIWLFSDKEHKFRCTLSEGLKKYFTRIDPLRKEYIKLIKDKCINQKEFDSKLISQSFKNIWLLQDFCKNRNIPMYHFHTYDPLAYDYSLSAQMYGDVEKSLYENIYLTYVEKDVNYVGHDYCLYNDIEKNKYFIKNGDITNLHANQEGHIHIAEKISKFIKDGLRPESNIEEHGELYRIIRK
tara:strand:+ start:345 stop:1166 length:822 start_codon:yes stop_codon:yes gene_type:complete